MNAALMTAAAVILNVVLASAIASSPIDASRMTIQPELLSLSELRRNTEDSIETPSATSPLCDLTADRGICLYGGQKVLVPDATSKGLVGRYSFDDGHCLDSSRNQNHGSSVIPAGPGRGGAGSSAQFDGSIWLELPSSESLNIIDSFSYSMWVYMQEQPDKSASNCPLMSREGVFSVSFDVLDNKLTVRPGVGDETVILQSSARLLPQQWTHISLVADSSNTGRWVSLFVNGVFEGSASAAAPAPMAPSPTYIGASPLRTGGGCQLSMLIDDLHISSRALSEGEIAAESFPALGPVSTSYAKLGCAVGAECSFSDASHACSALGGEGVYHLCSKLELAAGGLQVARLMGWTKWDTPIWENTLQEETSGPSLQQEVRVGICCRD